MKTHWLWYWLAVCAQPLLAAEPAQDVRLTRDLRAYLQEQVAQDQFSGVVLVAKNGRPVFQQAYGYANRAFKARNTLETKFNIASVGKAFTAVAILQLIEQGKLSADDPMLRVLPDYPRVEGANTITIRHLLQHKSGLNNYFGPRFDSHLTQLKTLHDYLPLFADEPLQFEPGTRMLYSNAGYLVLGLVIEQLTAREYSGAVHANLFDPAGMSNTGYFCAFDDVADVALGYTRRQVFGYPPVPEDSARRPVSTLTPGTSAGGAFSTAGDLLRFSEALRTHVLLNKASIERLLTGEYGLLAGSLNGMRFMGGGGGKEGISTYLEMFPDQGYTLIVLSNYDDAAPPIAAFIHRKLAEP